jgi:AraC-like DNA-binding protein
VSARPKVLRSHPLQGVSLVVAWDGSAGTALRATRENGAPDIVVGYCRSGSCVAVHGDARNVVAPGDSFVFRRGGIGTGADLVDSDGFSGVLVTIDVVDLMRLSRGLLADFDVDVDGLVESLSSGPSFRLVSEHPQVVHVLAEIMTPSAHGWTEGYLRLKVIELLRELSDLGSGARHHDVRLVSRMSHERIAYQAQQIMMGDLESPKTIAGLAVECGTSPTILKQSFRETFGVPIYTWYRGYRVQQAAQMLSDRPEMTISEAANAVGYSNPSKFSKAFAACMGETPSSWRAKAVH